MPEKGTTLDMFGEGRYELDTVCRSERYWSLYPPIDRASINSLKGAVFVCNSCLISLFTLKTVDLYEKDNHDLLLWGRSLKVCRHKPWRRDNTTAWNLKQGEQ